MFGIGSGELLIILVIAVLVVGPEKMVQFSAQLGRIIAKLRAETSDVTKEFREAFDLEMNETQGKAGAPSRPDFKAPAKAQGAAAQGAAPAAAEAALPAMSEPAAGAQQGAEPPPAPESPAEAPPAPVAWVGPLARPEPEPEPDNGEFKPSEADLAVQPVDIAVGEMVVEDEEVQPMELDGPMWIPTDEGDTSPISEEENV
jgi:sec-independent protein translocase protein TatB